MMKNSKWVKLDVLKYDLHDRDGNVILKAGTEDVDVLFRGGAFKYKDDYGSWVRANKYRDSAGRIYYGH